MKYNGFQAAKFHDKVNKALRSIETILETNRAPKLAAEVHEHQYDDKYALVEFMTNTSIAATFNLLEPMGLTPAILQELQEWIRDKQSVTLRLECQETCNFLREANVNVVTHEGSVEVEKTSSSLFMGGTTKKATKHRVTTTVKEYHWKVGCAYRLVAYAGSDPLKDFKLLQERSSATVIVSTGSKKAIFPAKHIRQPQEVNITWLLQQVSRSKDAKKGESHSDSTCKFKIDRGNDDCRTPVRNADSKKALKFFQAFSSWASQVVAHFDDVELSILQKHQPAVPAPKNAAPSVRTISSDAVFCPVVPLLEDKPSDSDQAGTTERVDRAQSLLRLQHPAGDQERSSPLLSLGDIDKFLNSQIQTLEAGIASLNQQFPPHTLEKLITTKEATLVLLCKCVTDLFENFFYSVYYVETLLTSQLRSAIGKEIQPSDFDEYMQYHLTKLFGSTYAPTPFCYAVRQQGCFPDAILSVEHVNSADASTPPPIHTLSRRIPGSSFVSSLSIPISAATRVEATGDRLVHGWMQHRFESSQSLPKFQISTRARQFSSCLVVIGVMGGANELIPKDAILVKDKDEVMIPLLLNELPSAKAFKDAISSLSPEQQDFAKSFRSMQLETSVVGVCVIQVRPQLEKLLNLPSGSLTKEIRLKQDLMNLFTEYQIPADMLLFDGEEGTINKVDVVKGHVKSVMDVIDEQKQSELEAKKQEAEMAVMGHFADFSSHEIDVEASEVGEELHIEPQRILRSRKMKKSAPRSAARIHRLSADSALPQPMAAKMHMSAMETSSSVNTESLNQNSQELVQPVDAKLTQSDNSAIMDVTAIPSALDSSFLQHDKDGALRTTTIKTGKPWTRVRQASLLGKPVESKLFEDTIKREKNMAFDLLEALSRGGALPIESSELHVLIAVTHRFDNTLMGTVIQDNVNPIEKVERSALMIGSTIHGVGAAGLIAHEQDLNRLSGAFPMLLAGSEEDNVESN